MVEWAELLGGKTSPIGYAALSVRPLQGSEGVSYF